MVPAEHSAYLCPEVYEGSEQQGFTPFLDSLMQQGYCFRQMYANGKRSIQALPAVWSSIPSFKSPFANMAQAVADAFRYSKLVLATTTYNADIFPYMRTYIDKLTERAFQNRTVAFIENGSWAAQATKVMMRRLEGSKNLTFTDTTVKILSALSDASRAQIEALAKELA